MRPHTQHQRSSSSWAIQNAFLRCLDLIHARLDIHNTCSPSFTITNTTRRQCRHHSCCASTPGSLYPNLQIRRRRTLVTIATAARKHRSHSRLALRRTPERATRRHQPERPPSQRHNVRHSLVRSQATPRRRDQSDDDARRRRTRNLPTTQRR